MTAEQLVELAKQARERAYVPYSGFAVGAALLCKDGTLYQGCNIENAAYGPTMCAERTAFFKAVYDGQRDFEAIAVAGGRAGEEVSGLFPPCGVCRQALAEFCSAELEGLLVTGADPLSYEKTTLGRLLPMAFTPNNLSE